jgi:hypothetical protein
MAKPSPMIEKAMPSSTDGTGTPEMPSAPPTAISVMNVSGTARIARPPKVGREDADRDHREDVVNPVDGCERP